MENHVLHVFLMDLQDLRIVSRKDLWINPHIQCRRSGFGLWMYQNKKSLEFPQGKRFDGTLKLQGIGLLPMKGSKYVQGSQESPKFMPKHAIRKAMNPLPKG